MTITNQKVLDHEFLKQLSGDDYFPGHLLDEGREILQRLCARIEAGKPASLEALYALTHAATDEFNDLDEELHDAGSEIETIAREVIADDFWFIAKTYGFDNADIEQLIMNRDW
ncbi:DUF5713 family protein [Longispora albida]|uniref:DUF5713 family protein n=1 Tax=Longispora albida TaxID=203523 RepID=UPI000377975C|nr:DUF5713 family protein [Longispora albida]